MKKTKNKQSNAKVNGKLVKPLHDAKTILAIKGLV